MRKVVRYGLMAVCLLTVGVVGWGCAKPQATEPGPESGTPAAGPEGPATGLPVAPDEAAPPGAKPTGQKWVLGMSQCNLGEPWRVRMNNDIKAAAAEHPELKVLYKDAQNDSTVQQNHVREFIDQGVDLIIISPKEAKPLTAPVKEAYDQGIPVIVLDRRVEGDAFTCFIGGDNVKIGREAGKYMVKLLGGQGQIVELRGLETSTPAKERHDGFMEGLKGAKIKILFHADCKWLQDKALEEMNSALDRFDQIDAVYGHNDPSAYGAYLAARQEGEGREKTIKFIGIDANPGEGMAYVKQGLLAATFDYPTGGQEAIDLALKILNGEEVKKEILLSTRLYTPENVETGGEAVE